VDEEIRFDSDKRVAIMNLEGAMNREIYLKLKYCPETSFCKVVRVGVIVFGGIILGGVIYNLSMLVWSLFRLAGS